MGDVAQDADLVTLMARVQAGDSVAYEHLLADLLPRVRGLVRRQRSFLPAEDVDDLVQDILLSVHVARATYDPGRPFLPWLAAIARNRLADAARRHARLSLHEVIVEELDVTFAAADPNLPGEEYRDPQALHEALGALPAGQRRAIEILKLGGLSLKEAAGTSGTSVGALKVATHRAMITLRKMLKIDG
jgi:RNA polymerase sigma factor (sigma-70 family)